MTNLTEQYRKGELPSGWYYIRDEAYQVYPAQYIRDYDYIKDKAYADFPNAENLVVDVLCECPKYKEWQELKKDYDELRKQKNEADNVILEQMAKVRQLKELLKLMRSKIKEVYDFNKFEFEIEGIFTKEDIMQIDQVLGEE